METEVETIIAQLCGCIDMGTLSKYGKYSKIKDVEKRRGISEVEKKVLEMVEIARKEYEAGLLDNEMLPELSEAKKAYFEGVRNVRDYYKEKGKYHENSGEGYIPQVGDFVAFKSSEGNHIGIVAGYDVETDTLYTYEGNASNAVKAYYFENVPDNTYIVGYCDNSGGIINVPDNLEIFVENEKGSTR